MEFSSLLFIMGFLPICLALIGITKREFRVIILLLLSITFYTWGEGIYALLLLASIVINYLGGLLIDFINKKLLKKSVFLLLVFLNIGFLIYFKYAGAIESSLGTNNPGNSIHLPLGISFFTFQALSFLIDIYRKTVEMDKNCLHFGLYMTLFPKLISGPITAYHDLSAQIKENKKISLEDMGEGFKRFIIGLGKKTLLADAVGVPVDKIFMVEKSDLTAGIAWIGILCYMLQIYFNFSGYTDMAIGLARMIGFKLPENFNYPYIARSIKDFWRRWHISLAWWLRDYLFLPIAFSVSRNIKKDRVLKLKAESWAYLIGVIITFLVCGIWHGANWTFVVWGLYYGVLQAIEHLGLGKWLKRRNKMAQLFYCQILVLIGWVIFRSDSLDYALSYLKALVGMGTGTGTEFYPALYLDKKVIFFFILGLIGIFPVFKELASWYQNWVNKWNEQGKEGMVKKAYWVYTGIYVSYLVFVLGMSLMVLAGGTYNPFIYFRF